MTCTFHIGVQGLLQSLHRNMYIELWASECNIETLGLHISKTTYPINMKIIEVM